MDGGHQQYSSPSDILPHSPHPDLHPEISGPAGQMLRVREQTVLVSYFFGQQWLGPVTERVKRARVWEEL